MLVKILVTIEEEYRLHRETMVETFEELRPGLQGWACNTEEIERYTQRLQPDVVICGRQNPGESGDRFAWAGAARSGSTPA